jgi:glutaredoxin
MSNANDPQSCKCNSLFFNSKCLKTRTGFRGSYVSCSHFICPGEICPNRANKTCYIFQQSIEADNPKPFICRDCVKDIAIDILDEANEKDVDIYEVNDEREASQAAQKMNVASRIPQEIDLSDILDEANEKGVDFFVINNEIKSNQAALKKMWLQEFLFKKLI